MKNPYIAAIERQMASTIPIGFGISRSLNAGERELLNNLLKEFHRIDRKFSIPLVSRLRKIADSCEAGGHKGRARMFRAVAKEIETREI